MSATVSPISPLLESLLAAAAQLSRDEKVVLVEKLGADLTQESNLPEWEIQLAQERLHLLDDGLSTPVPWEDAKARLDLKWGRK